MSIRWSVRIVILFSLLSAHCWIPSALNSSSEKTLGKKLLMKCIHNIQYSQCIISVSYCCSCILFATREDFFSLTVTVLSGDATSQLPHSCFPAKCFSLGWMAGLVTDAAGCSSQPSTPALISMELGFSMSLWDFLHATLLMASALQFTIPPLPGQPADIHLDKILNMHEYHNYADLHFSLLR